MVHIDQHLNIIGNTVQDIYYAKLVIISSSELFLKELKSLKRARFESKAFNVYLVSGIEPGSNNFWSENYFNDFDLLELRKKILGEKNI